MSVVLFLCVLYLFVMFFFFFKQKTAYDMRISDWSSDVCSSDLKIAGAAKLKERLDAARLELDQAQRGGDLARAGELSYGTIPQLQKQLADAEGATKGAMLREEVTDDDIAAEIGRAHV